MRIPRRQELVEFRSVSRHLSILVVLLIVLGAIPLMGTSDPPSAEPLMITDLEEDPTGIIYPEPNAVVPIQVTNPSSYSRPNEIVWYKLILRDFQLWGTSQIIVRNATSGAEVLSGALASTATYYPSGYLREIDVVLQDDFAPGESK
ncbi:MAG: hypothetical protein V3U51_05595, partial [Thermoplasmata archaeon]